MIKIAKLTDYAVVLLGWLGRLTDAKTASTSALAEQTGFSEATVSKILKKLVQAKLVLSERGVTGGYRLAKPADVISICEVVEAMDGPIAIASCVDAEDMTCQSSKRCVSRGRWKPVNDVIRQSLSAMTVRDMTADLAPINQKVVQISRPQENNHVRVG